MSHVDPNEDDDLYNDDRDDGGPAFMVAELANIRWDGMSLRDYFAAKAMGALIQAAWINPSTANTAYKEWKERQPPGSISSFDRWLACRAIDMADVMLEARK